MSDETRLLHTFAIVGRPNVGKSALFNRIIGKRIAIVHEEAGVTRDCIEATGHWGKREFRLLDTGGMGWVAGETIGDDLVASVRKQVERATAETSVFFFVVDGRDGLVPLDREVASYLRRAAKPTFVVVNKVDNETMESFVSEFSVLGFPKMFPVSATHGLGVAELLDEAVAAVGDRDPEVEPRPMQADTALKITIVGRPNVGKSSLINRLLDDERLIVSPTPGTTRDAVDVPCQLEVGGRRRDCVLIDTAGIRRTKKIQEPIEFFSVRRAEESIRRSDVVILLLDAETGITAQDKKVGGKILEAGRGCVLAVNKWDLIGKPIEKEFLESVGQILFFLHFAPVIFLSAKTGFGLKRLTESIEAVAEAGKLTVATGPLNRVIGKASERRALSGSGRLKIRYATQKSSAPPTFVLFVNDPRLWNPAAAKYLANALHKELGFLGWPIRFDVRMKKPVSLGKKR